MSGGSQPAGEITLVFSDIEGSTKLLKTLGTAGYREALAEHRRVVRDAFARYSGYEVDYEGDAFFYAFSSPRDAVSAVSEAMEGLRDGPISIRVGIHTGSPEPDPPKYVGMDVHTAARIMSSGHGGQVVVSPTTAALVDLELAELGEHRLKDLAEPIPLYQLGDGSFPPLKTISNTNLPRPASSFLGREAELAEVLSRIEAGARLITLTGPGGAGKTRLALEAASALVSDYKAGVFWVGLATLREPALVPETIARTLGATGSLASHIADREMLLLLDNFEHVIEAAPELGAVLGACHNLRLLVTSRELLRISGEVEYPVPPLATADAVELFCARAQLEPTEEAAELCARLDSLPLAVELAAARTKALTVAQILERLSGRLDLLKGGRDADPRQQTLRATIAWSYELLSSEERELFARLSVFAGGCTLEAAEEICDADLDTMQSLVEKSLLRFTEERYWMLETIREFADERLHMDGAGGLVEDRHSEYFVGLVGRARDEGPAPSPEWLDRLERDQNNLRAVFRRLAAMGDDTRLLDLLGYVLQLWWLRGERSEGLRICRDALAIGRERSTEGRGRTLKLAGLFAITMGDSEAALGYMLESESVFRELENHEQLSAVLINLGGIHTHRQDYDAAMRALEEAALEADVAGFPSRAAAAKSNIANIALQRADFESAAALAGEALALARAVHDESGIAMDLFNLAFATYRTGRHLESGAAIREGLDVAHRLGDLRVLVDFFALQAVRAARAGDAETGALLFGAALEVVARNGFERIGGDAETVLVDEATGVLSSVLGSTYVETIERGRTLAPDEAVRLALASLD
jgi:predicted ATPase